MNWVDFIILTVLAYYITEGIRRGFIEQLLELIGFILTFIIALKSYNLFAPIVADKTGLEVLFARPIAFALIWAILQTIFTIGLHLGYRYFPIQLRRATVNHVGGIIPALGRALIILAIVLTIMINLPIPQKLANEISQSAFGSRLVSAADIVESSLNKIAGGDIRQTLTVLTVPPRTEEVISPDSRVNLNFNIIDVEIDQTSEEKMLMLVNEERVSQNRAPLVWDEALAEVARAHSRDMFAKGYFSHQSLEGLSPFDRMARAGITFRAAGENIAYAMTVDLAFSGLIRSPGHRANILDDRFGKAGFGVIDGGPYGRMFTQLFKD